MPSTRARVVGVGEVVAVVMGDRAADDLALGVAAGEGGVGVGDLELHLAADEAERGVAHQDAGQQAGFGEDLEAVADAEHLDARERPLRGRRP